MEVGVVDQSFERVICVVKGLVANHIYYRYI